MKEEPTMKTSRKSYIKKNYPIELYSKEKEAKRGKFRGLSLAQRLKVLTDVRDQAMQKLSTLHIDAQLMQKEQSLLAEAVEDCQSYGTLYQHINQVADHFELSEWDKKL